MKEGVLQEDVCFQEESRDFGNQENHFQVSRYKKACQDTTEITKNVTKMERARLEINGGVSLNTLNSKAVLLK